MRRFDAEMRRGGAEIAATVASGEGGERIVLRRLRIVLASGAPRERC